MGQRKGKHANPKRSGHFKPDSKYIKIAKEEFESRGGRITKLSTVSSFDKKTMSGADMHMEPNQDTAEIVNHVIHPFNTQKIR